jgi:hypothetical protein
MTGLDSYESVWDAICDTLGEAPLTLRNRTTYRFATNGRYATNL